MLREAASRADEFKRNAQHNVRKFEKERDAGNYKNNVTKKDYDRWIAASKKQVEHYSNLYNSYKSLSESEITRKQIKEAKNFINKSYFTDADFADYYYKGKQYNYLLTDNIN